MKYKWRHLYFYFSLLPLNHFYKIELNLNIQLDQQKQEIKVEKKINENDHSFIIWNVDQKIKILTFFQICPNPVTVNWYDFDFQVFKKVENKEDYVLIGVMDWVGDENLFLPLIINSGKKNLIDGELKISSL